MECKYTATQSSSLDTTGSTSLFCDSLALAVQQHCSILICSVCPRLLKFYNQMGDMFCVATLGIHHFACRLDAALEVILDVQQLCYALYVQVKCLSQTESPVFADNPLCHPQFLSMAQGFTVINVFVFLQTLKHITGHFSRQFVPETREARVNCCQQNEKENCTLHSDGEQLSKSYDANCVLNTHAENKLSPDLREDTAVVRTKDDEESARAEFNESVQESNPADVLPPSQQRNQGVEQFHGQEDNCRLENESEKPGDSMKASERDTQCRELSDGKAVAADGEPESLQPSTYLLVKRLTAKCERRSEITRLYLQESLQNFAILTKGQGKQQQSPGDTNDSEEQTTQDSVILKELTSAPTMRFAPGVQQKVATYMTGGPGEPVSVLTAELCRLASFVDNTKVPKSGVWVTRLAAAGFYCPEKNSSFVRCAFCDVDVKIEDLRGSGDPMELHRRHFPFCSFVKGQSSNVTLQLQGQIAGLNVIHGFFGDTCPIDQEHSSRGVKDQHKDTPISEQERRRSECLQSSASARGHGSGGGAARIQPHMPSTSLPTHQSPRGVSSPSPPASMPTQSSLCSHTPVNSLPRRESNATGRTTGVQTAPTGHHTQAASSQAQGSATPTQLTESAISQNTHVTQSSLSSGPIRAPATESALPFQTAQPISTHQQETSSSSQTSSASASPQASTNNSASQSNFREAVAHPGPATQAGPPPSSTGEPERQLVTYSQLGIYTQEPKRSDFAIAATRAGSFTAWPHPDTHNPQDMAEAGFYYVGQDDLVRCFYCKGGLKSWAPHLRPWVEHARFFPKCPFVGQVKGQDFVDVVQELKERQETISAEQVEEELTARQRDTQALSTLPPPEGAAGGVSAAVGGADENTDVTQLAKVADDLENENKEILDARICKICQINDVSILFLPCGHLVSCAQCAPALRTCAICRQRVKGRVRVIEK